LKQSCRQNNIGGNMNREKQIRFNASSVNI
jgi:hypothetical protein